MIYLFKKTIAIREEIALSTFQAEVVGVTDGDTITVLVDGKERKVVLEWTDTPEKGQPLYEEAKQFTASLVAGKTVEIEGKGDDVYGRIKGIVRVGDKCLNEELIEQGLAWVTRKFCKKRKWKKLEDQARQSRVGLWEVDFPIQPSVFRRSSKLSLSTFQAKVVKVADGDTISVLVDGKIRDVVLCYIDTPEMRQAYGEDAKQFTDSLVAGKTVEIRGYGLDRYRRIVAVVYVGDTCLNTELIEHGLAWVSGKFCNKREWVKLAARAIEKKVVLWAAASPVPPWVVRRAGDIPWTDFVGTVVKVPDGDTVNVSVVVDKIVKNRKKVKVKKIIKVRLNWIDTPEIKQDFGTDAKAYLAELVLGKQVVVEGLGVDKYGRTIGLIRLDDLFVNEEMVRSGCAWVFNKFCDDQRFKELEELARRSKVGLWAAKNPIPPWVFRHPEDYK